LDMAACYANRSDRGAPAARFARIPPRTEARAGSALATSIGMSRRHELRCYDYVNHPYADVRDALWSNALAIFKRATTAAAARANDLGVELRVRIGAIEVSADVDIQITAVEEVRSPFGHPATKLTLDWKSARRPGLFPAMTGELTAYALSSTETQLEFFGNYT